MRHMHIYWPLVLMDHARSRARSNIFVTSSEVSLCLSAVLALLLYY